MATYFTNAGTGWIAQKMSGAVTTTQQYIGWGTGAGTTAKTDTTLFTEDSGGSPTYARGSASPTTITTTNTNDTHQVIATITSNGSKTITNAGLFDASTSGVMLVKGDFSGIPMLLNDQITFTIQLQITNP